VGRGRGVECGRGVGCDLGVAVGVGVGVALGDTLGVAVGVGVETGVAVGVGVGVAVGAGVGVGVTVGVGVGLGAEHCCKAPMKLPNGRGPFSTATVATTVLVEVSMTETLECWRRRHECRPGLSPHRKGHSLP